jgi:hypothetical protein
MAVRAKAGAAHIIHQPGRPNHGRKKRRGQGKG